MRYRKKPLIIEAVRLRTVLELPDKMPDWLLYAENFRAHDSFAEISTLEGIMRVDIDDWVIRGTKGELYPCKPDIFAEVYEEVE